MRAVNEEVEGYYLLSLVRQGWGTLMMIGVCCVGVGESSTKLLMLLLSLSERAEAEGGAYL